jgi:glycosyltransferase involved in cell wall biosynthesis
MKRLLVLPFYEKKNIISQKLDEIELMNMDADILFVDDGSSDSTALKIKTGGRIYLISHEVSLGYGGCFQSALSFAENNYDEIIFSDLAHPKFCAASEKILSLLNEAQFVSLSRIKKNEEDGEYAVFNLSNSVTAKLNSSAEINIADPFSPFKGFKYEILKNMILEEFDESLLLQLWIQSVHFKIGFREEYFDEIACESLTDAEQLENDLEHYIAFIKGEILLYPPE